MFLYLEKFADFVSQFLLILVEDHRIADFFSLTVPFNFAIKGWRFASFSMGILRSYCINLSQQIKKKNIFSICQYLSTAKY